MFCPNCGTENYEGKFCVKCGASLNTTGNFQNRGGGGGSSTLSFDGDGGEYLGIFLVNSVVLLFTCGFAFPWVVCRNLKWRKEHTIVDGHRLAFTGTPGDLFSHWLTWWVLSIVTCGIYTYWLNIRIREWEMSHTCFEDEYVGDGAEFQDCFYDGEVGERLGQSLVAGLMITFTCGLATPWAVCKIQRYDAAHTVIHGRRLAFKGSGADYWGESLIISLLSTITCGIYYAWGICRMNKWVYRNTYIQEVGSERTRY